MESRILHQNNFILNLDSKYILFILFIEKLNNNVTVKIILDKIET